MSDILLQKRRADQGAAAEGGGDCAQADEACPHRRCELRSAVIACGHGARHYKLDLTGAPNHDDQYLLQVISRSDKPDEIVVRSAGACGCGHGNVSAAAAAVANDQRPNDGGYCPTVRVQGPGVWVEQPGNVRVQVYPRLPTTAEKTVCGFFERVFLVVHGANHYRVTTHQCGGGTGRLHAAIEVFPALTWQVKYAEEWHRSIAGEGGAGMYQGDQGYRITYDITVTRDREQWQLSDQQQPPKPDFSLFALLRIVEFGHMLNNLAELLGRDFNLHVTLPTLRVEGNYNSRETAHDYTVRPEYKVRLSFDPLLVCNIKANLLPILRENGKFSEKLYSMIKKRLRQVKTAAGNPIPEEGARFDLFVNGEVRGDLVWQQDATQDRPTMRGNLQGTIEFGAEASLEGAGSQWLIQVKSRVTTSLKSAASAGNLSRFSVALNPVVLDSGPGIDGSCEFTGLAWYYSLYVEVGVERLEDRKILRRCVARVFDRLLRLRDPMEREIHKEGRVAVIFEPFVYPRAPAPGQHRAPVTLNAFVTGT